MFDVQEYVSTKKVYLGESPDVYGYNKHNLPQYLSVIIDMSP